MGLQPRPQLSQTGPPPNANYFALGRKFIGTGDPNGRVAGYKGDEYLDTETEQEWHKVDGIPRRETQQGWVLDNALVYTQAEVDAMLTAAALIAKVGVFVVDDIAELRTVPRDSNNKLAILIDRAVGEPPFMKWDNTSSAADDPEGFTTIVPDGAPATGRWIQFTF